MRRTHAAVDRHEQPHRRAEKFEIARVSPIPACTVLARDANCLIERGADLTAAHLIGLLKIGWVDIVFGTLAARQQFRSRAHQSPEFFEPGAG